MPMYMFLWLIFDPNAKMWPCKHLYILILCFWGFYLSIKWLHHLNNNYEFTCSKPGDFLGLQDIVVATFM